MPRIIGIDPGASGALALLEKLGADRPRLLSVHDMPILKIKRDGKVRTEPDPFALAVLMDSFGLVDHAYIERVNARPGEGVTSAFSFGRNFGTLLGLISANYVPLTLLTPMEWKRGVRLAAGADKDASRRRASQLMPEGAKEWLRVKDDGRAEAALIGYYGANDVKA